MSGVVPTNLLSSGNSVFLSGRFSHIVPPMNLLPQAVYALPE